MPHTFAWLTTGLVLACAVTGFGDDQTKAAMHEKKKEHVPRITSHVFVKPMPLLTEHEANEVSFAAGRILKHVSQARTALQHKKLDKAELHVDQGLKLVSIIDGLLPRQLVKTEIKSGDHVYLDEDQLVSQYATIYSELDQVDVVSPVVQAKKDHAHQHQGQDSKNTSAGSAAAYVVSHEELQYSAIKIDLTLAAHKLTEAKRDLQDSKPQLADDALQTIQTRGVIFEFEEIDLPLKEAADNLKLAEREMKQGHREHAKAALHVASDQLKLYQKKTGESRSAEVQALHQEIDKLTTELEKPTITEADAQKHASSISEWWQRSTRWFKKK
ncbi:MAG: YfdX protein [Planctomycetaceae bacterium]|nr:YfdX protein [Planctomycetaceae bacterium]